MEMKDIEKRFKSKIKSVYKDRQVEFYLFIDSLVEGNKKSSAFETENFEYRRSKGKKHIEYRANFNGKFSQWRTLHKGKKPVKAYGHGHGKVLTVQYETGETFSYPCLVE